jgi:hypothetical protein
MALNFKSIPFFILLNNCYEFKKRTKTAEKLKSDLSNKRKIEMSNKLSNN